MLPKEMNGGRDLVPVIVDDELVILADVPLNLLLDFVHACFFGLELWLKIGNLPTGFFQKKL